MRKLLYFIIGITISMLIFVSYSDACVPISAIEAARDDYISEMNGYSNNFLGYFATSNEAFNAVIAAGASSTSTYTIGSFGGYNFRRIWGNSYDPTIRQWAIYQTTNVGLLACVADSDSDGIPDSCDMYPNDPEPYSVKLVSYQTVDGTSNGEHVRETYQTDRGDFLSIGADDNESTITILTFTSPWIDPADLGCDDANLDENQTDLKTEVTPEQPTYTTEKPSGEAESGISTGMSPGSQSTGSETDNEALRGIKDNTGKTADNIARVGDYLKDLNSAIKNMDRNIALSSGNSTTTDELTLEGADPDELTLEGADPAEAVSGQTDLNNFDVAGSLSGVNGDLIEGTDFDVPGELKDETFVSEFINSNPLKTVFDNSGFTYTASSCQQTLNLGYLGSHNLNICSLEAGLILFGNLLVAFTTLIGLIHVATGRGF